MTKILFIGGVSRSGKSLLAHQVVKKIGIPYLSLDILKMALHREGRLLDIDPNEPLNVTARKLWPLVRAMAENAAETDVPYLFEGEVTPGHVADFRDSHADIEVRAVFLGYPNTSVDQKMAALTAHAHHPNDWIAHHNEDWQRHFIRERIDDSVQLANDCADQEIPFVDTSEGFTAQLHRALDILTKV